VNLAALLSNAVMANLLSGLLGGLIGAAIMAVIPFVVQRREWARRDAEMDQECLRLAQTEKEAELLKKIGAIRALAIESFTNAISFLIFAQTAESVDPQTSAIVFSRRQFEGTLPSMSQWLDSAHFEQTVIAYMEGFVYEQWVKSRGPLRLSPERIKRAKDLSQMFEIIFRTLARDDIFSKDARNSFEVAFNVLKQSSLRS
jgi:hypothetical protein